MAQAAPFSISRRISSTRHAVVRGPSFTGAGKRPDFTPAHHVDLLTGISGEIQSLQRLSEDYRELEKRFDAKLGEIQSKTDSLSTLVNVFVGLAVAVIVGFLILVAQIMLS